MELLSKFLQENILTLLIFDDEQAKIISSLVTPNLFDGEYSNIAKQSIGYVQKYNTAPKDHVADILEDILTGDNANRKALYEKTLFRLKEAYEGINTQYVMNSLTTWVRQQELKLAVISCGKILQDPNLTPDDAIAEIEDKLHQSLKKQINVFSEGKFLGAENSLGFLNNTRDAFPTGISELDKYDIGPARGELFVTMGLAGSGKTMGMLHIAKNCLLQRLKVCHISLEMSEDLMLQRYYQSMFGIPKRYVGPNNGKYVVSQYQLDSLQRITGLSRIELKPKMALEDPDIRSYLQKNISRWGLKMKNLIVKQFPDGSLTVPQLRAYLDGLETHHNFVPDILIIDYVDKMKFDVKNYRHEISQLYVQLRGLGVERNFAVVTATQSNRLGVNAKLLDTSNAAESWDKIAIADVVITYTQTKQEKALGLARLYVAKNRNDMDGQVILITQNYHYDQYCLKSAQMVSQESYFDVVKQKSISEGYSEDAS